MKILIQNPGKKEDENKHSSYFIFRKYTNKIKNPGIITSPLAMENSLAESKFFGRGLRITKYHIHHINLEVVVFQSIIENLKQIYE